MAITYGLQVWDTQAFPLIEISSGLTETFDLPKLNAQRKSLMRQHAAPSQNILKYAESLRQQSDTLSNTYPWITPYLEDLSTQFRQQSTALLTINIPKNPARFTILAYIVSLAASQHHMVTYNTAGDFYMLPLPARLENSSFISLYNHIHFVPAAYVYGFMKIYRNALIAEQIVKPTDLIDWGQYSLDNFDREFEARDMIHQHIKENFIERGIAFDFQEKTRSFRVLIKKTVNISYFLDFGLSIAIERQGQGIGRIIIEPYITVVYDQKNIKLDSLLVVVNNKLQQIFDRNIDNISMSVLCSALDLRNNCDSTFDIDGIMVYSTWPELFNKIDQFVQYADGIVSDIRCFEDFLDIFQGILNTSAKLNKIVGLRGNASNYFGCLILCKIFKPDLMPKLCHHLKMVYMYLRDSSKKQQICDLVDEIQNYELPT
jgi:hypothetical protein